MTRPATIRRWLSLAEPVVQAAEISRTSLEGRSLAPVLKGIRQCDLDGAVFLIAPLGPLNGDDLRHAINAANAARLSTRICLAVDCPTLRRLDVQSLNSQRVGLVLDSVDAETPLSFLVDESLEAIRFSREFVSRAGHNLRLQCVLEAMLGLAENLGLCTLGPVEAANEEGSPIKPRFDFILQAQREPPESPEYFSPLEDSLGQATRALR